MTDPFDMFDDSRDGPSPEKKYGLVVGEKMSLEAFVEKFVNRKLGPADYAVEFEIMDEHGNAVVETMAHEPITNENARRQKRKEKDPAGRQSGRA
jgi:hypothetical protein